MEVNFDENKNLLSYYYFIQGKLNSQNGLENTLKGSALRFSGVKRICLLKRKPSFDSNFTDRSLPIDVIASTRGIFQVDCAASRTAIGGFVRVSASGEPVESEADIGIIERIPAKQPAHTNGLSFSGALPRRVRSRSAHNSVEDRCVCILWRRRGMNVLSPMYCIQEGSLTSSRMKAASSDVSWQSCSRSVSSIGIVSC